jgi:15-cis-phytoene synthase
MSAASAWIHREPDCAGAASDMADGRPSRRDTNAATGAARDLADAYEHCASVARARAANFYYGIRLLPADRRRAICAVYAFARRVDDIGDGTLARAEQLRGLDAQAQALARLGHSPSCDPVMIALADAYARFQLPDDALLALIEGVRMDVEGVRYERFDDLVLYGRRVAGTIGRACLAIFALRDPDGTDRARADALADDLGVALQLTNILRDVREDAENGRVYLPAEDLRRFGVIAAGDEDRAAEVIAASARAQPAEGDPAGESGWVDALVRFEADRARRWFDRGIALASLLDRRSGACVLAMAGIYGRLLQRIADHPARVLRERIALPAHEKALVVARSMFAGGAGSHSG